MGTVQIGRGVSLEVDGEPLRLVDDMPPVVLGLDPALDEGSMVIITSRGGGKITSQVYKAPAAEAWGSGWFLDSYPLPADRDTLRKHLADTKRARKAAKRRADQWSTWAWYHNRQSELPTWAWRLMDAAS